MFKLINGIRISIFFFVLSYGMTGSAETKSKDLGAYFSGCSPRLTAFIQKAVERHYSTDLPYLKELEEAISGINPDSGFWPKLYSVYDDGNSMLLSTSMSEHDVIIKFTNIRFKGVSIGQSSLGLSAKLAKVMAVLFKSMAMLADKYQNLNVQVIVELPMNKQWDHMLPSLGFNKVGVKEVRFILDIKVKSPLGCSNIF